MKVRRSFVAGTVLMLVAVSAPANVRAQTSPSSGAPTASEAQRAEVSALSAEVNYRGLNAIPDVVTNRGGVLSGPKAGAPGDVALGFVRDHAALWRLTAADLAGLKVIAVTPAAERAGSSVTIAQNVGGVPVHESSLHVTMDAAGRVLLVEGNVYPALKVEAAPTPVGAAKAVQVSAASVREPNPALPASAPDADGKGATFQNPYTAREVAKPLLPTADQVVLPIGNGATGRLAWRTVVQTGRGAVHESVVDSATGALLDQQDLVHHDGPEGNVYEEQHPLIAGADQDIVAFGPDWVTDRVTQGNNADAFHDLNGDGVADYRPQTPASGDPAYQHFDYTYTDAIFTSGGTNVTTDRNAVITQAFYYVNMLHDRWYGYGFDETSRNFQRDNFGKGGAAGDAVLVRVDFEFSNGSCCNAFMFTPGDGTAGELSLLVGLAPGNRNMHRAMNGDTVTHEFGHGVSNRLVGAGSYGGGSQADALGEGWSDTQAFTVWNDPVYGDYNNGNTTTGIRSVAYNTSGYTYGNFCVTFGCGDEHGNGEIWATAMWDVRQHLIDTYGQAAGTTEFESLLIQGMKNTGTSPTFLSARDAFLTADTQLNAGANFCGLWAAFARNGMGGNASTPNQDTAVQGFNVPVECSACPVGLVPTITGTSGPDNLVGTSGNDVISGLGGNDRIIGMGGDDTICGGEGEDQLLGVDGNDTLFGDAGNDKLAGGVGNDKLYGGLGADDGSGEGGDDMVYSYDAATTDRYNGGPHVSADLCVSDTGDSNLGGCNP